MTKHRIAAALADDLVAVQRRRYELPLLGLVIATWAATTSWMAFTGELRPSIPEQLLIPRFATELVLGFAASTSAFVVGLMLSVPGRMNPATAWWTALTPITLWVGLLSVGLLSSAIEPSMAGKREHCVFETLILALPALAVGLAVIRRFAPFGRGSVGACLGLAAASVPALLMQVFCMYDPFHGLTHHLAPVAVVAAIGAVSGRLFLPHY